MANLTVSSSVGDSVSLALNKRDSLAGKLLTGLPEKVLVCRRLYLY